MLYKVDNIEGKNLGCIALKTIKRGTLIVQEKLVCCHFGEIKSSWIPIWNSYNNMSQSDRLEYDKLYNRYKEIKNLKEAKKWRDSLLETNFSEEIADLTVEVFGIYFSNSFTQGVGIQTSRFNHSCAANTEFQFNESLGKMEVRAVSKIKPGEEITINYLPHKISMKNVKTRQEYLLNGWKFNCMCNLCIEEGDSSDEKYEEFAKLQEEAEILSGDETNSWIYQLEKIKKEVSCYKEMYKLAKEKNVSREFIINYILNPAIDAATQGYLSSFGSVTGRVQNQEFKSDCNRFSKAGEQISTDVLGREHPISIEWKKKRCDFDAWIKYSGVAIRSIWSDPNQF